MSGITAVKTGTGTNDNDTVIEIDQGLEFFDTFMLTSSAGAMDVFVDLDGEGYESSALSLADLGATTTDPVIVTAAGRVYGFRGKFEKVKVLQNGVTGVVGAKLRYGKM